MPADQATQSLAAVLGTQPRKSPLVELTGRLLDYLLSGAVQPGAKIPPERQLADALGVGRSSVREAIKSLSLLGLLDVRQGDGTYLSRSGSDLLPRVIEWGLLLGEPTIRDLLEARGEIEVSVAGLAAERADGPALAAIRNAYESMEAAGDDVAAYVDADIAFHLAVASASGNETLQNLITSLRSLLGVWAARVLEHAQETATSLAVHRPILEAIEQHDAAAARDAMAAHMARARRRLDAALAAE